MSVDLRLMRHVIAVAEAGGFEAAAERLHMTQPPLSRQIRDLERNWASACSTAARPGSPKAGQVFVEAARRAAGLH
ncbi:LysR family transcriptional regulator [Nonomuraea wenchangensis]